MSAARPVVIRATLETGGRVIARDAIVGSGDGVLTELTLPLEQGSGWLGKQYLLRVTFEPGLKVADPE